MNVLVIGSGAREHALVWAIARSTSVDRVFAAPGNPGTAGMADVARNVPLDVSPNGFDEVARFCLQNSIDLVVIGPENPLADGMGDYLREAGIAVFGPGRRGAMLEVSKGFAMDFMKRHGIPHPEYRNFESCDDALEYISNTPGPWVIKADGLAMGKGVSITEDRDEAKRVVGEFMSDGKHGDAGRRIVVQEFLEGRELSAMALTDGDFIVPLPLARDHKRVGDGDRGPMTGGMGAFSPVDLGSEGSELERRINEEVLNRAISGLRQDGIDFRGVLYAGLMLTKAGPKVLEYNVRFGDPETQCVLPRLKGDFANALLACAAGKLRRFFSPPFLSMGDGLRVSPEACVTVVVASGGYPTGYPKGIPISGLDESTKPLIGGPSSTDEGRREVVVFHAGTKIEDGVLVTSGGRVLSVTALAPSLSEALRLAYAKAASVRFEGAFYRKDIGR